MRRLLRAITLWRLRWRMAALRSAAEEQGLDIVARTVLHARLTIVRREYVARRNEQ